MAFVRKEYNFPNNEEGQKQREAMKKTYKETYGEAHKSLPDLGALSGVLALPAVAFLAMVAIADTIRGAMGSEKYLAEEPENEGPDEPVKLNLSFKDEKEAESFNAGFKANIPDASLVSVEDLDQNLEEEKEKEEEKKEDTDKQATPPEPGTEEQGKDALKQKSQKEEERKKNLPNEEPAPKPEPEPGTEEEEEEEEKEEENEEKKEEEEDKDTEKKEGGGGGAWLQTMLNMAHELLMYACDNAATEGFLSAGQEMLSNAIGRALSPGASKDPAATAGSPGETEKVQPSLQEEPDGQNSEQKAATTNTEATEEPTNNSPMNMSPLPNSSEPSGLGPELKKLEESQEAQKESVKEEVKEVNKEEGPTHK